MLDSLLDGINLTGGNAVSGIIAVILSALLAFLFIAFLIVIAVYLYTSFAFMAIGKKAKLKTPEIAWIPGVGPMIIAFQSAKMHWWPWILLSGVFISMIPLIGWFIGGAAIILFSIYTYIWTWKMFEVIKRPGWWALLPLSCLLSFIPIIGIFLSAVGGVAYFVLIGIAAWSKKNIGGSVKKKKK